ncbi:MAG TPA: class I SAM-dependent methyltransferase [Thermoplasmata archaeon]|nr:class I SAM-dependent methyltransferase [Thermoplasmata archaeon]
MVRGFKDRSEYRVRKDCRLCHSKGLRVFIDFGRMPLAGDFLLPEDVGKEPKYPLRVAVCDDCFLVQVPDVVSREVMFSDYRYLSSVTSTLRNHFVDYADEIARILAREKDPLVVEIGANDGVLLKPLQQKGLRAVGIEPARNVARIARERGLDIVNAFATEAVAARIVSKHGEASLVTASNVFAHIDDMDQVMRAVSRLLRSGGRFVFEVHYLPELFRTMQYDFFYHEHLCYYSLTALRPFLERHGFRMTDALVHAIHGGSIRVHSVKSDSGVRRSKRLEALFREESKMGMGRASTYRKFGARVREHASRLRSVIEGLRKRGKKVAGYGAPGRGNTLLCYARIGRKLLPFIVDASPSRYGRFTPGTHIPILPADYFRTETPDVALLLAWTYQAEIAAKERWFLERGGEFVIPLPKITVVRGRKRGRRRAQSSRE